RLAHPPRDQLAELRSEIENENRLVTDADVLGSPRRSCGVTPSRGDQRGPREFKAKPPNSGGSWCSGLAHPHVLGLLKNLALGDDRRGDHQLGVLELGDVV